MSGKSEAADCRGSHEQSGLCRAYYVLLRLYLVLPVHLYGEVVGRGRKNKDADAD